MHPFHWDEQGYRKLNINITRSGLQFNNYSYCSWDNRLKGKLRPIEIMTNSLIVELFGLISGRLRL